MLADFSNNLLDWPLQRFASPRGRHDTEIATMDAAARRFKDVVGQVTPARKQFAPGERTVRQIEAGLLIVAWLERARGKIANQRGPGIFRVTDHDRVRVGRSVVRN